MITRSSIWWLNPACVFAVAGVGISAAAYAIPESIYRTYWRMPKFFDGSTFEITMFCVAVFVFGSIVGSRLNTQVNSVRARSGRWDEAIPWDSMLFLFRLSFWLCTLGYVFWIALAIQRGITPEAVLGIVTGEKGAMYDARYTYLPTVGGITTLTQFGTAAMIFGALIGQSCGWKVVRWKLSLVFLFAVARAVVNS